MPLEALRYDVTPAGLHYLLIHFDIPAADAAQWRLAIGGQVERPRTLTLEEIRALPAKTLRVTLECAGNGRGQTSPRYPSMPWLEEGVSTAEWTGTPLAALMEAAGVRPDARELVFRGTDRGIDRGTEHDYARSLTVAEAMRPDVLVVYAMNGQPLLPQHGAPLRLVVPGWYGMASVKWLANIDAVAAPFDGIQQLASYHFRAEAADPGVPCTHMRVNSLMAPPGIPDFFTRRRLVNPGPVRLFGRAWSGGGVPIARVEVSVNGVWGEARLDPVAGPWAWRGWSFDWEASPGEHVLACRATDANGNVQPGDPRPDIGGFGNNATHRVSITVCD
ncbi:MAG: sulfite oxidase [Betaproteobacteria bacterium]|nr:sulfite oxidase [Betaproteobacteria bacterium]